MKSFCGFYTRLPGNWKRKSFTTFITFEMKSENGPVPWSLTMIRPTLVVEFQLWGCKINIFLKMYIHTYGYLSFVCVQELPPPKKGIFEFLGITIYGFCSDWPIPAILVIPDDHEGCGVRSSENAILSFSYRSMIQWCSKTMFFLYIAYKNKK